jgi:hypothetical protein
MAELSALDTDLLSQDLPERSQVAVESPVYAGGRGLISIAQPESAAIRMLMLHGLGSSSDTAPNLQGCPGFHVIA